MYNKYTYDFSKPTAMNINPNLADCFEQTDVSSVDINKILNDINSKFIEQMEENSIHDLNISSVNASVFVLKKTIAHITINANNNSYRFSIVNVVSKNL